MYATGDVFYFVSPESPLSTFQCNLDGAGWHACTSPTTVIPTPLIGSHTFQVRAVLGNLIDPVGDSRTWTILGPDAKITSGPSDPSYAPNATFGLGSDEPGAAYLYCSLDGGAWTGCYDSSSVSYSGLEAGFPHLQGEGRPPRRDSRSRFRCGHADVDDPSRGEPLDLTVTGTGIGSVTSIPAGITHCIAA